MTPLLRGYLLAWLLFCLVAVAVAVRDVRLRLPDVRAFLRVPWKVALFVPAIVFVTLAGRFTDDETWDLVSGGGDIRADRRHVVVVGRNGCARVARHGSAASAPWLLVLAAAPLLAVAAWILVGSVGWRPPFRDAAWPTHGPAASVRVQ